MSAEITLLTVPKYGKGGGIMRLKELAKKILGRKRGPDQVINSLLRGLDELGIEHNLNPKIADFAPIVHVPLLPEVIRQAIHLKKQGLIKTLIAGPSIVITPLEADRILFEPEIDKIVLPSEWVRNLYISLAPSLANKIEIWPAGVKIPDYLSQNSHTLTRTQEHKIKCLLYSKNAPDELQQHILKTLNRLGINCSILTYGNFRQGSYFKELEKSDFAIFLSPTESQGLAIQEAWARNIPTLVWNKKVWEYGDIVWRDDKISAPYLTDACGEFFTNDADFDSKISIFTDRVKKHSYTPRQYVMDKLTDRKSAERLLEIVNFDTKNESTFKNNPTTEHKKYFDYLDALRCMAFLLVFYAHTGSIFKGANVTQAFPLDIWQKFTVYGSYGVNFFFVLSGFLITYLLLKEKASSPSNTISIRSFYRKRVLRIWPVYFATLFFGALVLPLLIPSSTYSIFTLADPRMSGTTFFYNLFFSGNFYQGMSIAMAPLSIGILWSVCIEEQFYLVWPWIVKWFNLRTLAFVTSLLITLSLLYKFIWAEDRMANYYLPWSLAMDLGFGALLGISYYAKKTRRIIASSTFIIAASIGLTVAVTLINRAQLIDILRLTKTPIIDCIFVLIILLFINRTKALADAAKYGSRRHPKYIMKKIRDRVYASLTHLGKISYGLYAYHTTCLMLIVATLHSIGILDKDVGLSEFFMVISLGFILTILVAELSYFFMERKFLAIKSVALPRIRDKKEKAL